MKQCPNCRITYTDDSLQFCLQDGTPLVNFSSNNADSEPETLVIPKKVEPIRFDLPSAYQTNRVEWQPNQPSQSTPETKKSNTAKTVALSVLGTILLLGLGGLGAWFYFNRDNRQAVVNVNVNSARNTRPANSNTVLNQNQNQNANIANIANASPSQTPTAQPTLEPEQLKEVANEVEDVVADWKNASENLDLGSHLGFYADMVDYYRGGKVGINTVRADKQRAYALYDSIDINIQNLKVTPDASGEKATALFDKEWRFEGENKFSEGKVQQLLTLNKIKGRWLITGEKDLKVYYTQN